MGEFETGERLSAAVGASGRRALRELRLLLAVGVLTLVGVALALVFHERPNDDHRTTEAGAADLAVLSTHDAKAMLLLYQYLGQSDLFATDATQLGSAALSEQTQAASTWRRFAARRAMLPGEAALRERYETLMTDAEEWGAQLTSMDTLAALASDPSARAALISSTRAHTEARIDALSELRLLYADELAAALDDHRASASGLRQDVTVAVAAGLATLLLGFLLLERSGRRRAAVLDRVEALLEDQGDRARLEAQLNRALEICNDEASAYRILETAVGVVLDDGGAELLVADSSLAHLSLVARTDDAASCEVKTPADCPAVRRGHTQEFPSPSALDACPQLRDRGGDRLTTCVPFTVEGSSVGVLHLASTRPLPAPAVTQVELIARKTGERVGVTRAFAKSQDQARTDPLTGLLNRRSLEDRAREIVESGRPYAVVFADLDHFKTLNDVHGHDAGDRALRLFSRCVREGVRPADTAARYGGEEFVLVLPDCDIDGATAVIARVREAVEHGLSAGTVPRFTASFGIAEAIGGPLADVIARSDAALLVAKRTGRNRSVVWSPDLGTGRVVDDDPAAAPLVGAGADDGEPVSSSR